MLHDKEDNSNGEDRKFNYSTEAFLITLKGCIFKVTILVYHSEVSSTDSRVLHRYNSISFCFNLSSYITHGVLCRHQ